jgi:hypothetical protein
MRKSLEQALEVAGMKFERPMKTGVLWSPTVFAVEGDFLIYEPVARSHQAHKGAPQGLLRMLLDGQESRPKAVAFCRRWGILGLCDHGLPRSHSETCLKQEVFRTSFDGKTSHSYYRESIDAVQRFARGLEAIVRIGAEMSQDRSGRTDDWNNACDIITGPDFPRWPFNPSDLHVSEARSLLQGLIARLIRICRLRPRFWWNSDVGSWQIDLDTEGAGYNLPAFIIIELILTIADKDGFAICSSCHRAYIPARSPSPSRRNYCPTVSCLRARACDASKDRYDRNKAKGKKRSKPKEKRHAKA